MGAEQVDAAPARSPEDTMRSSLLAALIVCAACSDNGDDSTATPGEESETDTDSDSDSDTDTDTDTDAWDATVIFVYAGFGYDADAGEIVNATMQGEPLDNAVIATVMDLDRYLEDPENATTWCLVTWRIPVGPIVPNPAFDSSYWLSFDLTDAEITWSGDDAYYATGDCDHVQSFMGMSRGDADLASFASTWGVGFGIGPLSNVGAATLEGWADTVWPDTYADDYGAWKDIESTLGSGTMKLMEFPLHDSDIVYAITMRKDGSIDNAEGTGTGMAQVLGKADSPPSGYYGALAMSGMGM